MENETELRVVQQEEQQSEEEGQPQNPPALRRRFVIYLYVGYFLARWSARFTNQSLTPTNIYISFLLFLDNMFYNSRR